MRVFLGGVGFLFIRMTDRWNSEFRGFALKKILSDLFLSFETKATQKYFNEMSGILRNQSHLRIYFCADQMNPFFGPFFSKRQLDESNIIISNKTEIDKSKGWKKNYFHVQQINLSFFYVSMSSRQKFNTFFRCM